MPATTSVQSSQSQESRTQSTFHVHYMISRYITWLWLLTQMCLAGKRKPSAVTLMLDIGISPRVSNMAQYACLKSFSSHDSARSQQHCIMLFRMPETNVWANKQGKPSCTLTAETWAREDDRWFQCDTTLRPLTGVTPSVISLARHAGAIHLHGGIFLSFPCPRSQPAGTEMS